MFGVPVLLAMLVLLPGGGVQGDALSCTDPCDVLHVRNIQGGVVSNDPATLNLDIGAGSTDNPGNIVLNFDVGESTLIYDGKKHLIARFGPDGITFYRNPKVRHP